MKVRGPFEPNVRLNRRRAEPPEKDAQTLRAAESPLRRVVVDFLANPVAVFGLALLVLILLVALLAPLLSPQNPYDLAQLDVMDGRLPPGSPSPTGGTYWLGTDDQGRDMLSAI